MNLREAKNLRTYVTTYIEELFQANGLTEVSYNLLYYTFKNPDQRQGEFPIFDQFAKNLKMLHERDLIEITIGASKPYNKIRITPMGKDLLLKVNHEAEDMPITIIENVTVKCRVIYEVSPGVSYGRKSGLL